MKYNHSRQDRDAPYLNLLPEPPESLVFIMGCHRSGTSLLYHLLARSGKVNYISAYDVAHYHELLYNRIHRREEHVRAQLDRYLAALGDRGTDRLPVSAGYPEEYRFILAEFHIPLSLRADKRTEFFGPHLTERTLDRFAELCRKKQFLNQSLGQEKPLILKNPNDFYCHFMTVCTLLPRARFIFLHRHPLQILNSHLQSFSAALEARSDYYALLDRGYRRLFGVLTINRLAARLAMRTEWYARLVMSQFVRSFAYYQEQVQRLPPDSYVSLTYEELCRDPEGNIASIGDWLGIDMRIETPEQVAAPRHLTLLKQAQHAYQKQFYALRPYLRLLKYAEDPDDEISSS